MSSSKRASRSSNGRTVASKRAGERSTPTLVRALKRENRALRKKLKQVENERDEFRRSVHARAAKQITPKDLEEWEKEIVNGANGGSLIDLIRKLEREDV